MDTHFAKSYGAVELDGVLPILAKSKRACHVLEKALGGKRGKKAVEMLRSGTLEGELKDDIYDHFLEEIENEAESVWDGESYHPNDPDRDEYTFSIGIMEYEGVFYFSGPEGETGGYFLSEKAAHKYVDCSGLSIRNGRYAKRKPKRGRRPVTLDKSPMKNVQGTAPAKEKDTQGSLPRRSFRVDSDSGRRAFQSAVERTMQDHPLGALENVQPWFPKKTLRDVYIDAYLALTLLTPEELSSMGSGEQSKTTPSARQSTSESQSSRETGNGAMCELKNEISDSNLSNACPYCQQDLDAGVCQHWVASLCDDSDGFDTLTPLYFGWDQHWNGSQEEMMASLDWYFEALCALCDQVSKKGPDEGKRILREAKGLPPVEKATLTHAIKILDLPDAKENYTTTHDLLRGEFGQQMKDLFTDFFLRCGEKIRKTDYLIDSNYPGYPTWSGTHYWAENPEKCVLFIIQEREKATDRINKFIYKR